MAKKHISFDYFACICLALIILLTLLSKIVLVKEQEKNYSKKLKSKSIELHHIQMIGCDGIAVNTKVNKKTKIRILNTNLQRPLK